MRHDRFSDIVKLLGPGDLLVINDTEVIPARLVGRKSSGGRAELLLLGDGDGGEGRIWRGLVKASHVGPGTRLLFPEGLEAEVLEDLGDGQILVGFNRGRDFMDLLNEMGQVPLPPYIRRESPHPSDRERYQTVYAARKGAVAAPTAGLHFTEGLFDELKGRGVTVVSITLHVGY